MIPDIIGLISDTDQLDAVIKGLWDKLSSEDRKTFILYCAKGAKGDDPVDQLCKMLALRQVAQIYLDRGESL